VILRIRRSILDAIRSIATRSAIAPARPAARENQRDRTAFGWSRVHRVVL